MQRRNKDKDQYLKFIAIIDIIMKNSDENHPLTVNQIKEKFYQQKGIFKLIIVLLKNILNFIMNIMRMMSSKCIKKEEICIFILLIVI